MLLATKLQSDLTYLSNYPVPTTLFSFYPTDLQTKQTSLVNEETVNFESIVLTAGMHDLHE